MKKTVDKALKWLLVFFVCITTFNLSILADEIKNTKANGPVTDFSIRWLETKDTQLTMEATNSNGDTGAASAELAFSVSKADIKAGDIKIKLPAKLFKNREGEPHGRYEIGIANSNVDYKYEYDSIHNEIIIINTQPITDAHTLKVQIVYYDRNEKNPVNEREYACDVPNNTTYKWRAEYEIKQGQELFKGESNELSVLHKLATELKGIDYLEMEERRFTWDSAWGEKPEDADAYIYLKWKFDVSKNSFNGNNALPFKLTLTSKNTSNHHGEVVKWFDCRYIGDNGIFEESNGDLTVNVKKPTGGDGSKYVYGYVIMKYPKSAVEVDDRMIKEEITATLVPYYPEDDPKNGEFPIIKEDTSYYYCEDLSFVYPPGNYKIEKINSKGFGDVYDYMYGAINKVNLSDGGEEISLPVGYSNRSTIEAGDLTLKDGGNPDNFEDYEKEFYETELVDDLIILKDTRLTEKDYSIPHVRISYYNHYTIDPGKIDQYEDPYVKLDDYTDMEPIDIYYSTDLTGKNWNQIASVKEIMIDPSYEYYGFEITNTITGEIKTQDLQADIDLPENAVAVKATVKSKRAKIDFSLDVDVNLKATRRVKDLVNGNSQVSLYNVSTLVVRDKDGSWVNANPESTIEGSLKDIVMARDKEIFGDNTYGQHDDYDLILCETKPDSGMIKNLHEFKTNSGEDYFMADCEVGAYNAFRSSSSELLTEEDFKQLNLLEEEKVGKIYDLLPLGAHVDEASLKAGYMHPRPPRDGSNFIEQKQFKVTIEYKYNWKDSGRTMAVFTIEVPQDYDNFHYTFYDGNEMYFHTGFAVKFNMIYPSDSITDYGRNIRNLAAYQSENNLFEGRRDDGYFKDFKMNEREWFTDIDEDGKYGEGTPANTLYAFAETKITDPIAAQIEFSKSVKNDSDVSYQKATEVLPGNHYSYHIRVGNGMFDDRKILESKNMVLFDVLEDAHGTNPYWKGTLESVDVTQLRLKGIAPKVYYSTKEGIQLNTDMNGELIGDADIHNSDIWSETMPTDKSEITAIAVDMQKKEGGSDFVLDTNTSLSVIVNMKAPNTNIEEYMKNQAKAYNDAWLTSSVKLDNTAEWTGTTLQCNPTQVSIRKADIGIDKTSDPASGTQEDPTDVQNNEMLTYDVAVTNKEISNNLSDIVVEDTIPQGLTIDFGNIKYYYNDDKKNAKLVSDSDDGISVERDLATNKQKLIFHIDTLKAKDTIHFLIPTLVDETDEEARYENQAVISGVGGVEYDVKSPITYHEKKVPLADFDFIKKNKQDQLLSNAKFVLYEVDCKDSTHHHEEELLEVDKNGDLVGSSDCFKNAKKAASTSDGRVHFADLKTNREYRLIEYEAPGEYVTPKGQWVVHYDEKAQRFMIGNSIGNPPGFEESGSDLLVRNYKLEELPSTGGRGLTKYMLLGATVMCIGGAWIYQNKKRKIKRL